MIKKLKTQKRLLENKPTSHKKQVVLKLENQFTDSAEQGRVLYQEKLLKNPDRILKHSKRVNRSACLQKISLSYTNQSRFDGNKQIC